MLEHLSAKFRTPPQQTLREPRAALILNRFTRTLTVMYATNAVADILGVSSEQLIDKSFYECMQENCLPDAIRCLESAKANDSIAYLRFWYRDPCRPEDVAEEQNALRDASHSSESEDGGVQLQVDEQMDVDIDAGDGSSNAGAGNALPSIISVGQSLFRGDQAVQSGSSQSDQQPNAYASPGESSNGQDSANQSFNQAAGSHSSSSSVILPLDQRRQARATRVAEPRAQPPAIEPYEIEAVVSCTSDGLVVVLRRARPRIPVFNLPPVAGLYFNNGLFAAPWGANPIRPHQYRPNPQHPFQHGFEAPLAPIGGPPLDDFMTSIREVAVFAWSLTGINGNIATYGHGAPHGEAQPPGGLPVWDPYAQPTPNHYPPENQAAASWAQRDVKMSNTPDSGYAEPSSRGDRPGIMAPRDLLNRPGYFYQGPGSFTNNGYENVFGPYQGGGASAGPSIQNAYLPPTTSAPGKGSAGNNAHSWQ